MWTCLYRGARFKGCPSRQQNCWSMGHSRDFYKQQHIPPHREGNPSVWHWTCWAHWGLNQTTVLIESVSNHAQQLHDPPRPPDFSTLVTLVCSRSQNPFKGWPEGWRSGGLGAISGLQHAGNPRVVSTCLYQATLIHQQSFDSFLQSATKAWLNKVVC